MFKRTVNGIAAGTASLLVGILGLAAGLPLAGDTALAQTPTNMVTIALPADPVPAVVTNFRCHILPVQGQTPSRPGCDDLHLRAAGPNGFTSPDLNNHGGPVVTNTTHTFYFLNCLSNCATDWGDPITFLTDLFAGVNSTFLHVTDQYTGQSTDGRYTTSGPGVALTASVTHTITDSQLHTIIVNGIKAQFPSGGGGGYGRMHSIFLPQGQDLCFDNSNQCYCPDNNCGAGNVFAFCAYHGSFDTTDAVGGALHVIYQAQPFDNVSGCQVNGGPNGALKDSVNNVFSHEIFETITDPDLNAWWRTATGDEIGDICNFNLANPISLNGHSYAIQKEYSNKAHTCVSSATTPSRVTHDFNTDGQSDISWRNTNSDLAIWLM